MLIVVKQQIQAYIINLKASIVGAPLFSGIVDCSQRLYQITKSVVTIG